MKHSASKQKENKRQATSEAPLAAALKLVSQSKHNEFSVFCERPTPKEAKNKCRRPYLALLDPVVTYFGR